MCSEKRKVVLDSCVYLDIMLEGRDPEKCQKEIEDIENSSSLELCITSPIIYETLERARKETNKTVEKRNDIIKEKKKREKENQFDRLIEIFLKLTKNASLLSHKGEKFTEIKKEVRRCLNENRDSRDIMNLAISINNEACLFITREKAINNSKNSLEKISKKYCREEMEIRKI